MAISDHKAKRWAKANPFQKFKSVEAARSGVEEGAAGFFAIAITHVFSAFYASRFALQTVVTPDPDQTPVVLFGLATLALVGFFYLRSFPNRFVALGMMVWAFVGLPFPFTAWLYGWAAFPAFNVMALLAGLLATRGAFSLHKLRSSGTNKTA